jgi:hypothetical protein
MEINIAIVGPLVSIIIQALKSTGWLSGRYVPLVNVGIALVISLAHSWVEMDTVQIVVNWGTIALATAGTYEMGLRQKDNGATSQAG